MRVPVAAALALLAILSIMVLTGCKGERIAATWRSDSIRVDGRSGDWDKYPRTVFKNPHLALAACNDSQRVFLLFHVNDPDLVLAAQRRGATVWFSTGGQKKTFGVTLRGNGPDWRGERPPNRGNDDAMPPDSEPTDFAPPALPGLAVLYGTERKRIPVRDQDVGMPAGESSQEGGGITFEFSVPLAGAEAQYGIDAFPGSVIMVGVEMSGRGAGNMGRHMRDRQNGGEGRGPGGMGGPEGEPPGEGMGGEMPARGQGGRPGMRGQHKGGNEQESASPQEIWFELSLAKPAVAMQ
ncbi:MAG TPA: hypothetical protein VGL38_14860 [bacterium]|jgi:hypothetical protein